MRVRVLCNLKAEKLISEGTIFEGDEKTLPNFIFSELKLKRGTIEVLPELKKVRKTRIKPPAKVAKKEDPTEKSASLREKLNNPEK